MSASRPCDARCVRSAPARASASARRTAAIARRRPAGSADEPYAASRAAVHRAAKSREAETGSRRAGPRPHRARTSSRQLLRQPQPSTCPLDAPPRNGCRPTPVLLADISDTGGGRVAMAQMLNSTVVPAIALAASLEELASLVDRVTDLAYLSRSSETESDGASLGALVASCIRQVSAVLAGRPVPIPAIEHSRQRGVSALRATVRDLDQLMTGAMTAPLALDPASD